MKLSSLSLSGMSATKLFKFKDYKNNIFADHITGILKKEEAEKTTFTDIHIIYFIP